MRTTGQTLELSASDLSHFLACRHRTALDLAVAQGIRAAALVGRSGARPAAGAWPRARAPVRGAAPRAGARGRRPHPQDAGDDAVAEPLDAMRAGVDLIIQPALRRRPLVRAARPASARRDAERVRRMVVRGRRHQAREGDARRDDSPARALLGSAAGGAGRSRRSNSTSSRPIRSRPSRAIACRTSLPTSGSSAAGSRRRCCKTRARSRRRNYPEPVEHCDVCRWWSTCDKRRRDDDHLIAGRGHLAPADPRAARRPASTTLARLGTLPLPLPFTPRRGAARHLRSRPRAGPRSTARPQRGQAGPRAAAADRRTRG